MTAPARIALLYSVPRSGSTYVEKAIAAYLGTHYGHAPLSELFNVNLVATFEHGRISVDTDNWRENTYQYSLTLAEVRKVETERTSWLLHPGPSYFLKLLEPQLTTQDMAKIFSHGSVTFCRRENIWEHLLSFLISMATHQFYPEGGVRWEPGTITAPLDLFLNFCTYLGRYRRLRKAHAECGEIVFEDFLAGGASYMRSKGFEKEFDWSAVSYPPQENVRDKELAFSNIDEIRTWYRQSYLHLLRPI
jgi:hypothetical protein